MSKSTQLISLNNSICWFILSSRYNKKEFTYYYRLSAESRSNSCHFYSFICLYIRWFTINLRLVDKFFYLSLTTCTFHSSRNNCQDSIGFLVRYIIPLCYDILALICYAGCNSSFFNSRHLIWEIKLTNDSWLFWCTTWTRCSSSGLILSCVQKLMRSPLINSKPITLSEDLFWITIFLYQIRYKF
jgi:hypothetical protein